MRKIAAFFSWDRELAALLRFEAALAVAEAAEGVIPDDAARAISECCSTFVPDMTALRDGTARDGVVMPELVRQLRQGVGAGTWQARSLRSDQPGCDR